MKAQSVMTGMLKLQIQPTRDEPPPDALPSSRSFGSPGSRFWSAGGSSNATFGLSDLQQVAVADVGQRRSAPAARRRLRTTARSRTARCRRSIRYERGSRPRGLSADEGAQLTYRAPGSSKRPGCRLVSAKRSGDRTREHVGQPRPCGRGPGPATTPASRGGAAPDRARAGRGSRASERCRRRTVPGTGLESPQHQRQPDGFQLRE